MWREVIPIFVTDEHGRTEEEEELRILVVGFEHTACSCFSEWTSVVLQNTPHSPVRCYPWILKPVYQQHKTLKLSSPLLQPCYLYSQDAQSIQFKNNGHKLNPHFVLCKIGNIMQLLQIKCFHFHPREDQGLPPERLLKVYFSPNQKIACLSSLEGLVQHDSQTNGRKSVKDDCPDDHAGVGSLKTEDVSVTKEWQEERKDGDGGDQVEEEVDPGEAK